MGALEGTVMDIIWEDGRWMIPAEVHAKLPTEGDLSYTTVMTTLRRLERKSRLDRRKDGRATPVTRRPASATPEQSLVGLVDLN